MNPMRAEIQRICEGCERPGLSRLTILFIPTIAPVLQYLCPACEQLLTGLGISHGRVQQEGSINPSKNHLWRLSGFPKPNKKAS
jgi:hypothetical protein